MGIGSAPYYRRGHVAGGVGTDQLLQLAADGPQRIKEGVQHLFVRAHTVVVVHGDHLRAIPQPELAAAMIAFYKKVDAAVAIRHQVRRCRF